MSSSTCSKLFGKLHDFCLLVLFFFCLFLGDKLLWELNVVLDCLEELICIIREGAQSEGVLAFLLTLFGELESLGNYGALSLLLLRSGGWSRRDWRWESFFEGICESLDVGASLSN